MSPKKNEEEIEVAAEGPNDVTPAVFCTYTTPVPKPHPTFMFPALSTVNALLPQDLKLAVVPTSTLRAVNVPTLVSDEAVTPEASVVPVRPLAATFVAVAALPVQLAERSAYRLDTSSVPVFSIIPLHQNA